MASNTQQDEIMVLSRILNKKNGNTLVGFVVLDMQCASIYRLSIDNMRKVLASNYCSNATWDEEYKAVVGTASSLTEYPSVSSDGSAIDTNGLTATHRILDKDTKEEIGAIVFDAFGKQSNLTCKSLLKLKANGMKFTNFTVTGSGYIQPKVKGYVFRSVEKRAVGKRTSYSSANGDVTPLIDKGIDRVPYFNVSGFTDISKSNFTKSAQDTLLMALTNLRKVSPYYHSVLSAIRRTPVVSGGTMAASEDEIFYDVDFVAGLSCEECTFILIHELMHILMRHSLRGRHKNHDLWNIATDMYINETICHECGINYLDETVEVDGGLCGTGYLKAQKDGVYAFKYGIALDLSRETPESIYYELLRENPPQEDSDDGYYNSNTKANDGQEESMGGIPIKEALKKAIKICNEVRSTAKGAADEAYANKDTQGRKDALDANNAAKHASNSCRNNKDLSVIGSDLMNAGSTVKQSGDSLDNRGNSRGLKLKSLGEQLIELGKNFTESSANGKAGKSDSGSNKSSGDNNENSKDNGSFEDLNGQQPEQNKDDFDENGNSGGSNSDKKPAIKGFKNVEVTFRGQKIKANVMEDVVSKIENDNDEGTAKAIDKCKEVLQRCKTKIKMDEDSTGQKFSSKLAAGLMNRHIEYGLTSDISWQKLLQNVTPRVPRKAYTMASPYKSLMNRGITVATRQQIGKPKKYTDIKFAIDVSGSVSQNELNGYLADISSIFNKYEVDAELIYWSTDIGDAGAFSNKKDIARIQPNSTGGTDVKCVFDYLTGKTKVNGKYEETKVRDIEAVFILTDGCFDMNFSDYKKYFGNKVVWVIDGDPVKFDPPFGRVVGLKREQY